MLLEIVQPSKGYLHNSRIKKTTHCSIPRTRLLPPWLVEVRDLCLLNFRSAFGKLCASCAFLVQVSDLRVSTFPGISTNSAQQTSFAFGWGSDLRECSSFDLIKCLIILCLYFLLLELLTKGKRTKYTFCELEETWSQSLISY